MGLPQFGQCARSAISEYLVFFNELDPDVHVIEDVGKSANVRKGAPASLRHVKQWQFPISLGRVLEV